jgi:hypothetical protein
MPSHSEIFAIRDRYLARYQDYLTGLSGVLIESLAEPNLPPPARIERINILASKLHLGFVQSIQSIRDDIQTLVGLDADPLVHTFISELSQDLIATLSDIARREAKAVSRLALETLMGVAQPLSGGSYTLLSLLEQRMRVMDSRGRRWRSERYAAISVQSILLRAVNESILYRAKPNARFKVTFNDPNKSHLLISLDDYRLPEIHDDVFHPNSTALIVETA